MIRNWKFWTGVGVFVVVIIILIVIVMSMSEKSIEVVADKHASQMCTKLGYSPENASLYMFTRNNDFYKLELNCDQETKVII